MTPTIHAWLTAAHVDLQPLLSLWPWITVFLLFLGGIGAIEYVARRVHEPARPAIHRARSVDPDDEIESRLGEED